MENYFIIIENILSINKYLLKINIISRLIIKLLIKLKMYKIEEDKLKVIINIKKREIKYKKVYQMGYNIIILYVLIYDLSIKNIIILILSVLDDFIELKKKEKLLISFLIILLFNKYNNNDKIFLFIYEIIKGIFKINSINILSGINGIELFQLISFLLYYKKYKLVSFLLPLFYYNKYPSKIFIGNGLLIYSSTKLININKKFNIKNELFEFIYWIPQLFNSIISIYQILFKICPRHRMPQLYYKKELSSFFKIKENISLFQEISILELNKDYKKITYSSYNYLLKKKINNLTILNLIIKYFFIETEVSLFLFFIGIQLLFFFIGFIFNHFFN